MSRDDSALLVVDVQEKLVPLIDGHRRIVWNIGRLLDGAETLGVLAAATEQYPQGLGPTVDSIRKKLAKRAADDATFSIPWKLAFSCGGCPEIFEAWRDRGIDKVLLCGIEAHVCVQQTAFDLLGEGYQVYLAVDAIGARSDVDREVAFRRMESAGATLTTTEAALFEWCDVAGTPEFKTISKLVRETPPAE